MKSYNDYFEDINKDELFDGLLGHGLFADKLPPVFSSESFLKFVKKGDPGFPKKQNDYVRYDNTRNINVPRLLAIPHPFAYYNLITVLKENWDKIKTHIGNNTKNQIYKISKVHLRKMKDTKKLFEMNYKTYEDDTDQDVDLVIGMRYKVNADISNCFPSIYSHSVPWALVGKNKAKKNNSNSLWQNKIDFFLRNTKNQETNGILIGPHTSNLISEIILIVIDKELTGKKYKFTRHVDDYTCFTPSKDEAERFLIDLSYELKKFELTLNHKKSDISELPHAFVSQWVRKLKHHRFKTYKSENGKRKISTKEVEIFLDLAIDLMHSEKDNSAILNYALKMLSKKKLDEYAIKYLIKRVHHLAFIYPYLIQSIDESVFIPFKVSKDEIKKIADSMFELGLKKKLFEACSYSLFFALKYDFKISGFNTTYECLKSDDCVLMTLSYLYSKRNSLCTVRYCAKAISLKRNDFDKYWLFIYEVLTPIYFSGPFKSMKKTKVSFVKDEYQ